MECSLFDIFNETCQSVPSNNCLIYISDKKYTTITYEGMKFMLDEMYNVCTLANIKFCGFVGIITTDLCPETISSLLLVLKCQAAFVFFESQTNIEDIIERLNIRYFICDESKITDFQNKLEVTLESEVVIHEFYNHLKILEREIQSTHNVYIFDPAFAVFSSGSTGVPKIIVVPHCCILPNIKELKEIYQIKSNDTVFLYTPPTFDPCILDIFLAFSAGSNILALAKNDKFNDKLLTSVFTEMATLLFITPSLFLKYFPKCMSTSSIKTLIFGGESFPKLNPREYPFLETIKVFNIYGITEVSCWSSIELTEKFDDVSLGRPLTDTVFEVRNEEGVVLKEGVGELFIGSSCRICYVNGENVECDGVNPYFRSSGDLVQIVKNKYYYVGRKDRRIKIFGHQIDLSSVEEKAALHPDVKICRSIFVEEESIVVLFVEASDEKLERGIVERFLKTELPSHMLPCNTILVPKIPVNEHGKICEKSCRDIYTSMKSNYNIKSLFKTLWLKYALQKSADCNHDSGNTDEKLGFLDCGGNSILALQFTASLSNVCNIPNEFIFALLSNNDYDQCLKLITSSNISTNGLSNNEQHKFVHKTERDGFRDEQCDPIFSNKRLKIDFGSLKRINCRGRSIIVSKTDDDEKLGNTKMKLRWKHDLLRCVDASPTVLVFERNAIAICGSHSGKLLVVDVESGDKVSEFTLPDRIESTPGISPCGKYFFIACYDRKVYCCNIYAGVMEWSYQTGDVVKCTPEYYSNKLYFGSYDHNFYCLSQEGILKWKVNLDGSSIFSAALITESAIVVTTLSGTVAFLDHCGQVVHRYCCGKPFFSSPCEVLPHVCLTIDVTGVMWLFNIASGERVWSHQVGGNVFSSISMNKCSDSSKIVFGCYDKQVYCFEITENAAVCCWQVKLDAAIYATPMFTGGENRVKVILVVTVTGNVYFLDAESGSIKFSHSINGPVFSSPVVYRNLVVVGCRDNNLYCLETI